MLPMSYRGFIKNDGCPSRHHGFDVGEITGGEGRALAGCRFRHPGNSNVRFAAMVAGIPLRPKNKMAGK